MSKIAAVFALLMLALGATAIAAPIQDYRSPDARQVVVQQDYRSPDGRIATATSDVPAAAQDLRSPDAGRVPFETAPVVQDLRSPDSGPSGTFEPSVPASSTVEPSADSFAWGYLAAAIAVVLLALSAVLLTYRRRHHGIASGA
jgi:hypothetical protein